MTSKEKAIEIITHNDAQDSLYLLEITTDLNVFNDNQIILSNYISQQRTQPTLDDAIKVVENLKQSQKIVDWKQVNVRTYNVGINNEQFEDITNYEPIFDNQDLFDDILTALKGLKEGKV